MAKEIDITDMEAALAEAEGVEIPEESKAEAERAAVAEKPAEGGFPNPLDLTLTDCHLPQSFVEDRVRLIKYAGQYMTSNEILKVSPTENELRLYRAYDRMAPKPVIKQMFSAAVRLIAHGKPLDKPAEAAIDSMGL